MKAEKKTKDEGRTTNDERRRMGSPIRHPSFVLRHLHPSAFILSLMNRTDRLLAIVLELQAAGWQRAEDLATRFEITKRTVYRDMQALSEAGVPIVSVPGQGYNLAPGYFLPPLAFTPGEATMLLLGADFVAQNFDAQYRAEVQAASRKIE